MAFGKSLDYILPAFARDIDALVARSQRDPMNQELRQQLRDLNQAERNAHPVVTCACGLDVPDYMLRDNDTCEYCETCDCGTCPSCVVGAQMIVNDIPALAGEAREVPMYHDCPVCSINIRVGDACPFCLTPATREVPMTTNTTPLQATVALFTSTDAIHDLLDAGNVADAFDALVTILHAARAIEPDNAVGVDLESSLDWVEAQMQAGVDMTKAIRNMIAPVEDFAFDMDDNQRKQAKEVQDMPADAPHATTRDDSPANDPQTLPTGYEVVDGNVQPRHMTGLALHAESLRDRGLIDEQGYANALDFGRYS